MKDIDPQSPLWRWPDSFLLGLDQLHTCKGHLHHLIAVMRKHPGWLDDVFIKNMANLIQRKDVSELDGAHVRLLFAMYRNTILPALQSIEVMYPTVFTILVQILEIWSEVSNGIYLFILKCIQPQIQWILYLPPDARSCTELRLRLHTLLFMYLQLCHSVFPDVTSTTPARSRKRTKKRTLETLPEKLPTWMTRDMLKDWIEGLCHELGISPTDLNNDIKRHYPDRTFSNLKREQLWDICLGLKTSAKLSGK